MSRILQLFCIRSTRNFCNGIYCTAKIICRLLLSEKLLYSIVFWRLSYIRDCTELSCTSYSTTEYSSAIILRVVYAQVLYSTVTARELFLGQ